MGSLYRRGTTWWIKYYLNGRPVRESTGTSKEKQAERVLKEREGRVALGQPILPRADRIRYDEAAKDLREHYTTTGRRNLREAEGRLKPLDGFFAGRRLAAIGPTEITKYVLARQEESVSNATINRELAALSVMLETKVKVQTMEMLRRGRRGEVTPLPPGERPNGADEPVGGLGPFHGG